MTYLIEKTDETNGILRNVETGESIQGTLHNLDAYLTMIGQLQPTIELIRLSPDMTTAHAAIVDSLGIDSGQADAILGLRLGQIDDLVRDHILTPEERAEQDARRAEFRAERAKRIAEREQHQQP